MSLTTSLKHLHARPRASEARFPDLSRGVPKQTPRSSADPCEQFEWSAEYSEAASVRNLLPSALSIETNLGIKGLSFQQQPPIGGNATRGPRLSLFLSSFFAKRFGFTQGTIENR